MIINQMSSLSRFSGRRDFSIESNSVDCFVPMKLGLQGQAFSNYYFSSINKKSLDLHT